MRLCACLLFLSDSERSAAHPSPPSLQCGLLSFTPFDPLNMRSQEMKLKELKNGRLVCMGIGGSCRVAQPGAAERVDWQPICCAAQPMRGCCKRDS